MLLRSLEITSTDDSRLWTYAWWLSVGTIAYNIGEGIVSIVFGVSDETLALFGFGADSFIEVVSAIGIAHMVVRLRTHGSEQRDAFERTALKVTGWSFYALTIVLVITSVLSVVTNHAPESTISGIIVSLISIIFMWALIRAKVTVGTKLRCSPIIADANCSKVCLRMSLILLASSILFELFHIGYIDAIGAVGLAWFSFKEGRECFEKASSTGHCSDDCC